MLPIQCCAHLTCVAIFAFTTSPKRFVTPKCYSRCWYKSVLQVAPSRSIVMRLRLSKWPKDWYLFTHAV